MSAIKSRWLWVVSACYLLAVAALMWSRWLELVSLELNEVGDLLAGIFSPLAFLWLVGGYFQQGEELRQNTSALKLQAAELKNSVEQQEQLVRVGREQIAADRERYLSQIEPRFSIGQIRYTQTIFGGKAPKFEVVLTNHGARAVRVRTSLESPVFLDRFEHEVIEHLGQWTVPFQITQDMPETGGMVSLEIACEAAIGQVEPKIFHLKLSKGEGDTAWMLQEVAK
jgi:hypothetical protein